MSPTTLDLSLPHRSLDKTLDLPVELAKRELDFLIKSKVTYVSKPDKLVFQPQPYPSLDTCIRTQLELTTPPFISELLKDNQLHQAGLLTEINCAYYLVGGSGYLWDLVENKYHIIEYAGSYIELLSLVQPQKEAFPVSVKYALVLSCQKLVRLVGISRVFDRLTLHEFKYNAPYEANQFTVITSSETGRIFLGSKEGDIHELIYQNATTPKQCLIRNCTQSYFARLTSAFGFTNKENEIISLKIDEDRKVLYSLDTGSKIKIINLGERGDEFGYIGEFYPPFQNMFRQIPITSLTEIHVVPLKSPVTARLMAVSSSGSCLFFKSNQPGDHGYATGLDIGWLQPSVFENQTETNKCSLYSQGLLMISSYTGNDVTSVALHFSEGAPKMALGRPVDQFKIGTIDGNVHDISMQVPKSELIFATRDMSPFVLTHDDLDSQYYSPCKTFHVLSDYGVVKITKLRPIDQLLEIFTTEENPGQLFKVFLERFGENETCCMALAIISKYPLAWTEFNKNILNIYNSNSQLILDAKLTIKFINMFKSIGGSPNYGTIPTVGIVSSGIGRPSSTITYSHYVSGALLYASRILRPVWSCRLFFARKNIDDSFDYEFAISRRTFTYVKQSIEHLIESLNKIPDYKRATLDQPTKKDSTSTSDSNSSALQTEQNVIVQLGTLLKLCSECLSFLLLLQESNLHQHIKSLEQSHQEKIRSLKFEILLLPNSRNQISLDLAILGLSHQPKMWYEACTFTKQMRSECQFYFDLNAINLCQGIELLGQARNVYVLKAKTVMIDDAFNLLSKSRDFMNIPRLSDVIISFLDFHREYDGLLLIAQCSYLFDFSSPIDFASPLFKIYLELIGTLLDSIASRCKKTAASDATDYSLLIDIIKKAFRLIKLDCFHITVYKWFLDQNLLGELYELNTPHLETFLKQCSNIQDYERLFIFYCHNKDYIQAAKVYFSLATSSSLFLSLDLRKSFLKKALETSEKSLLKGATDRQEFKEEIERWLNLSEIQTFAIEEYLGSNSKKICQDLLTHVKNNLLSSSKLDKMLVVPHQLYITQLFLLDFQNKSDEWNLLIATWKNIIDSVKRRLHDSSSYQRLASVLHEKFMLISKKIPYPSPSLPLSDLCGMLINLSILEPEMISPEWILKVFLDYGVPLSDLIYNLDSLLIRRHPPYGSPAFLKKHFCVLTQALDQWFKENPEAFDPSSFQERMSRYYTLSPDLYDEIKKFSTKFNHIIC